MKRFAFAVLGSLCFLASFAQDFNTLITQTADTLSKKIIATGKKKIAITDFLNIDESITQLGTFLSNEVSSELANLTENQTKFRVLERANLDQIFKEKHLVGFADPTGLAKELGKVDAADALIFATITDFDGYYRVVIKMLDTKNGDALTSYKVSFVKTSSLENLNKQIVKKGQANEQTNTRVQRTNNPPQDIPTGKGDFCFNNIARGAGYHLDAKISVFKTGELTALKTISVREGETTCIYDLAQGIYRLDISWIDGFYNKVMKQESKEIRVISGKSGTMDVKYN